MDPTHEIKSTSFSDPESVPMDQEAGEIDAMAIPAYMISNKWQRLVNKLELSSGIEASSIERVGD